MNIFNMSGLLNTLKEAYEQRPPDKKVFAIKDSAGMLIRFEYYEDTIELMLKRKTLVSSLLIFEITEETYQGALAALAAASQEAL